MIRRDFTTAVMTPLFMYSYDILGGADNIWISSQIWLIPLDRKGECIEFGNCSQWVERSEDFPGLDLLLDRIDKVGSDARIVSLIFLHNQPGKNAELKSHI